MEMVPERSKKLKCNKASRGSSETSVIDVELPSGDGAAAGAARWFSISVLVLIVSSVAVMLALPLLPFFLKGTVSNYTVS